MPPTRCSHFVVSYAITESVVARTPAQEQASAKLADGPADSDLPIDRTAAAKLSRRPDRQRSFDVGLDAMIAGLLP